MTNTTNTKSKPNGADAITAAANELQSFQLETLDNMHAIESSVTNSYMYEADSLESFGRKVWSDQARLTDLRDEHGTLALVGVMRRFHTTDGVLWGEKVSSIKVAQSFGSYIGADGKEKLNVPKGRISKALKLASEGVLAELFGQADDPHEVLAAFLEERVADGKGVSIETLWNEQFASDPKAQTLPQAVANLLAWASKNGIEASAVLAEVLAQLDDSNEG